MKRIIALLSCLVLMIALFSTVTVSASDPASTPISTAEELLAVAASYEDGNFKGTYHLTNDIDLGGKPFSQYVFKHFNGVLDGQGHKIFNFSFDGSNNSAAGAGFFSWFGNSADTTVKNLQIGDATTPIVYNFKVAENGGSAKYYSFFASEPGNNNAATNVTVENVHIYATANLTTEVAAPKFNFGGLFGYTRAKNNNYVIKDCSINGEINAVTAITAGTNYINIGGFVGAETTNGTFTMEDCTNNANITLGCSTKEARATGFIAYDQNGALSITNCINLGKVTVLGDTADCYVSGFVGDVNNASGTTLTNCINAAELAGAKRVGGMIALVRDGKAATITDCTNYGTYTATATAASASVGEGAANATITNFADKTGETYNPGTGDMIVLSIIAMAVSFAAIVMLVSFKKKKVTD